MKVDVLQFNEKRPLLSSIKDGYRITFYDDQKRDYIDYCSNEFGEGVVQENYSHKSYDHVVILSQQWEYYSHKTKDLLSVSYQVACSKKCKITIVVDSYNKLLMLTQKFGLEYKIDVVESIETKICNVVNKYLFATIRKHTIRKMQVEIAAIVHKQWYGIKIDTNDINFEYNNVHYNIGW